MDFKTSEQLQDFTNRFNEERVKDLQPEQMKTELLLVHDATQVFSVALEKLKNVEATPLICGDYEAWMYGSSLLNFMRTVSTYLREETACCTTNLVVLEVHISDNLLEIIWHFRPI